LLTHLRSNAVITYKRQKAVKGIKYNTPLESNTCGESTSPLARCVHGNVTVYVSQNGGESVKTTFKNRSSNNDATTFVQRLKVASAPLWTKNVFDIAVEYSKEPTMRTVDTLNVYTVPDFNIRAAMEIEDKKTATTMELPLKVSVGRYNNSTRKSSFSRTTMGDWDVTIYAQKS
ncbi:hypothetical protein DNP22_24590, partial [Salmonella enterica subsp. enterica serovar Panama]